MVFCRKNKDGTRDFFLNGNINLKKHGGIQKSKIINFRRHRIEGLSELQIRSIQGMYFLSP